MTAVKAFVCGDPIKHSRSPLIHGHWIRVYGLEGTYVAKEVAKNDFRSFVESIRNGTSEFKGGNVTIPHKEAALQYADQSTDLARKIGAANTLWLENGRVHADNTDVYGFVANLDAHKPGWENVQTATILGAGGASRAIVQSLIQRDIREIRIVNRTFERARELAQHFGSNVVAYPMRDLDSAIAGAGLFINTTSLGMDGGDAPVLDFSNLAAGAVVTDIVYVPLMTPILQQAQDQDIDIVDGLGMLLHQAVPGFEKWFGVRPEVTDELRNLIIADMENSH